MENNNVVKLICIYSFTISGEQDDKTRQTNKTRRSRSLSSLWIWHAARKQFENILRIKKN
jgi:hypothetical protein